MRITSADVYLIKIPLRFSVDHALSSRSENTAGFLVLTADDGLIGIGEFLCREYVTGETLEDCIHCLERLVPQIMRAPISDPLRMIEDIAHQPSEQGQQTATCAIDLAVLDLWGRQHAQPVASILHPGALDRDASKMYSAVYPFASGLKLSVLHGLYRTCIHAQHIKVKGTGDIDTDMSYVESIRRAFPYSVDLRLDLNGSLQEAHATQYFTRMLESHAGIRWFEQPFPKDAWGASHRFQQKFQSDIVLCADESVCSMQDLQRAIAERAFRAVNIRIGKNGGLLSAWHIYKAAIEHGLETQLGCLVGESSVLSFAGLHFAAIAPKLRYHEGCFGKYLVKQDVVNPPLTFAREGAVRLMRLPQAGLTPPWKLDLLRRRASHRQSIGKRA